MSRVSIQGNDAGSGTFTIAAPDSNNNRTFNLPDETGVVVTDATDLEPQVKTSLNATGDAPLYACRAWVQFDGLGTVSISGSGNVSSITDNGTGDYTVNFSTAMPDENYAALADGSPIGSTTNNVIGTRAITATGFNVLREKSNGNANDDNNLSAAAFR